ncbi:NUDIX domain-containing protein [Streptomyces sp. NPDC048664]|uniref:NUDIX domain-containing protein n=1 Tax=Streptomyces sp. NPDC048664 TaxID=3154505 RepID=UPI003436F655
MSDTETPEAIRYTADVVALTPGGHVDADETSPAAAARELMEETGVQAAADDLRQIGVWDSPGRDPRGRYVTVAYAVVVPENTRIVAGDDARTARWWPLDDLPEHLAFDQADILHVATAPTS